MKRDLRILVIGFAASLLLANTPVHAQAPDGRQGGRGRGGGFTQDSRVQTRMYHFEDTNEELPYSLYVSTKVTNDRKAPLVVTLHGLGATQTIMMTKAAVDLAEEGGYILASPLGYNTGGWYGSPVLRGGGRGRGNGRGAAPDAPAPPPPPPPPANLGELSEKDVMNVIGMVRKEFNVDDRRIYLMGHSMGGAGTLFLGSKYASMWAAIGAEAPADFAMNNTRQDILQKMKDVNLPVMIVQGDMDEAVPVTNTRMWVDTMKEMNLNYEYVEQPGITHGPVIQTGLKPIYEFFAKHTKQ
jgi:poly(3-hydroxybutyrate) depolymerase